MPQIDHGKYESKDWVKYRFDFIDQYNLTINDNVVYAYIFRHCKDRCFGQKGYWLGESNEKIANGCRLPIRTVERSLKNLADKKLIIIQNPGKRTNQAGQSRMILLNDNIFILENQVNIQDIEIENKDKEIERLKKQIAELLAEKETDPVPCMWLQMIIDAGLIPEKDIPRAYKVLNTGYESFAAEFQYTETKKHITYMINELKDKKITEDITRKAHQQVQTDIVQYLAAALDQRFNQLHHWRNQP